MWKRVTAVSKVRGRALRNWRSAVLEREPYLRYCLVLQPSEPETTGLLSSEIMSGRTQEKLIKSVVAGFAADLEQEAANLAAEEAALFSVSEDFIAELAAAVPEVQWTDLRPAGLERTSQSSSSIACMQEPGRAIAYRQSWPTPDIEWVRA